MIYWCKLGASDFRPRQCKNKRLWLAFMIFRSGSDPGLDHDQWQLRFHTTQMKGRLYRVTFTNALYIPENGKAGFENHEYLGWGAVWGCLAV